MVCLQHGQDYLGQIRQSNIYPRRRCGRCLAESSTWDRPRSLASSSLSALYTTIKNSRSGRRRDLPQEGQVWSQPPCICTEHHERFGELAQRRPCGTANRFLKIGSTHLTRSCVNIPALLSVYQHDRKASIVTRLSEEASSTCCWGSAARLEEGFVIKCCLGH